MHLAVRMDEFIDGFHELLLVVLVETLENLEAAQLQLGVHERVLSFTLGNGFGEEILHLMVDCLEHLKEMRCVLLGELGGKRSIGDVRSRHSMSDQLADVISDEGFFRFVKVPIDVSESGHVEDDRAHLFLCRRPIRTESQHAGRLSVPLAAHQVEKSTLSGAVNILAFILGHLLLQRSQGPKLAARFLEKEKPRPVPIDVELGGRMGADVLHPSRQNFRFGLGSQSIEESPAILAHSHGRATTGLQVLLLPRPRLSVPG
jgi:hypothetical protein